MLSVFFSYAKYFFIFCNVSFNVTNLVIFMTKLKFENVFFYSFFLGGGGEGRSGHYPQAQYHILFTPQAL